MHHSKSEKDNADLTRKSFEDILSVLHYLSHFEVESYEAAKRLKEWR